MKLTFAGLDIGGTKCAATIGRSIGDKIELIDKISFPTPPEPEAAIERLGTELELLLKGHPAEKARLTAIGISCGGPLDSGRGLILSPPNLPEWDRIDVVSPFKRRFGVPVGLQNDANACALAEWKWGAGRGTRNMVFLTFGTGMGAGLILDGRLYAGTNDNAGEVGHVRLAEDGPAGYGKAGSFEGFCSGAGIARLAQRVAAERLEAGGKLPSFYRGECDSITTKDVAEAARQGDPDAVRIFREVGRMLGRGAAMLIDILNPQRIVIGSIYGRQQELLQPVMMEELRKEALGGSLAACAIVPAGLGEQVGDYAALSVAGNLVAGQ
ncbi:ROK family protein [Paenibacillus montanisoli]|uniref:ROK family protein n=1 Tax=Paenibacillus montanisoli TaxID=2081970 RepID=A0A328TXM7_9BACL|nr:ROK family protein [Paenibacillus montanisoli]RAP75219.1 ROK family protein [Paenibacillus montanisoli]